jgi:RNA recognition motif-containing protein
MESEASEESAIQSLDGAEWMGRVMKVNKARPREEKNGCSGGWSSKGENAGYSNSKRY